MLSPDPPVEARHGQLLQGRFFVGARRAGIPKVVREPPQRALELTRAPRMDAPGQFTVYADGSCIGNPGTGGWGVLMIAPDGATSELAGAEPSTTNNRMEITAALEALREIPAGAD